MADPGGHPCTYTLHGNVVAGVSWRPTRFTEALPLLYVCSNCGVVPERTLVTPCLQAFCDLCLEGSTGDASRDNVWQCPFDGCVCNVEECLEFRLPPLTDGDFKAYCWNEARGCTFVGDLPSILHHFDHDCSFHAVTCPRCDIKVLRVELSIHQRRGCSFTSVSPDTTSNNADVQSMRYCALTLDDVTAAFQEMKAAITSPGQQHLVDIRSHLSGLQQQVQSQFELLSKVAGAVQCSERSLKDRLEQVNNALTAVTAGDSLAQLRPTMSGPAQAENGKTYSTDGCPMPRSVEKKHILRKLEITSDDRLGSAQDELDGMALFQRRPGLAYDDGEGYRVSDVFRCLPQLQTDERRGTRYELRVANVDDVFKNFLVYPGVFGIVTLWHTRFTYCMVVLGTSKWEDKLDVYFKWANVVESPLAMPKDYSVTLVHRQDPRQNRAMKKDCQNNAFPMGCQHRFWTALSAIHKSGLVDNNTLTFHVSIKHEIR